MIFVYVGVLSLVMRSVLLGPIVDRHRRELDDADRRPCFSSSGLLLYPLPQSLWPLAP